MRTDNQGEGDSWLSLKKKTPAKSQGLLSYFDIEPPFFMPSDDDDDGLLIEPLLFGDIPVPDLLVPVPVPDRRADLIPPESTAGPSA